MRFHDDEQDRDFAFLTNAFHLTALEIANLYKNRWQIELFFKWLKQHLKIKKFWGTTENAVRIQISAAITAYCLVAILQHDMQLKRPTYEVLQILSMSLTDKTPLQAVPNRRYYQILLLCIHIREFDNGIRKHILRQSTLPFRTLVL